MRHERPAFTFSDLVIVVVLIALLIPAVVTSAGRSRESAGRVWCGSNLRQIGQALLMYSNENQGTYPRTVYRPGAAPTQYSRAQSADPFSAGGPAANDVTAAMFLLLRTQDIEAKVFVCKTTELEPWDFGGKVVGDVSNFPGERYLGYSFANPYPDGVVVNRRFPFKATWDAEYAVAADMNPGSGGLYAVTVPTTSSPQREMQRANSRNHQSAGENVLYGDGHVEFQQTPFCGVKRDNIYTVSGSTDGTIPTSSTVSGSPAWIGDSVLLPVATMDPERLRSSWTQNAVLFGGGAVLLVVAYLLVRMIRGERARLSERPA